MTKKRLDKIKKEKGKMAIMQILLSEYIEVIEIEVKHEPLIHNPYSLPTTFEPDYFTDVYFRAKKKEKK